MPFLTALAAPLGAALANLAAKAASQVMLEKLILWAGGELAKQTKFTDYDDKFFAELKKLME